MIDRTPRYTHYAYMCGPMFIREPVSMFNWDHVKPADRAKRIGRFMDSGHLVARIPFAEEVNGMADLRRILAWIENKKRGEE